MLREWTIEDVETLFELAGVKEDFCYDMQSDKIVCGGWNRVYLYSDGTVKVSYSHSHPHFLVVCRLLDIQII